MTGKTWKDLNFIGRNYDRAYVTTDDPRVVGYVERDTDPHCPIDGDAYAPAYALDYREGWVVEPVGSTYRDDEVAEAYTRALNYYGVLGEHGKVARYLSIFHGASFREVEVDRGDFMVILDTPAWREHCGIPAEMAPYEVLEPQAGEWRAYGNGEVYGVGYAVNMDRVSDDAPLDIDSEGWTVEVECWGVIGDEWAATEAHMSATAEAERLHPLLPLV